MMPLGARLTGCLRQVIEKAVNFDKMVTCVVMDSCSESEGKLPSAVTMFGSYMTK